MTAQQEPPQQSAEPVAIVPSDPPPETLRRILVDMAYDLHLVPDGDEVPVQFLAVLRRQYFAAIEAGASHAAPPAVQGEPVANLHDNKTAVTEPHPMLSATGTETAYAEAQMEIERLRTELENMRRELNRAWREVDFIAKERTEHLEWRTKLANDLDECERMRDVLARTVNVLDAENKELRSDETAAWMIVEPGCEYGPTFGTENAAWSALTKAPPGSELVELIRRKA